jgi:transposase
MSRTHARSLRGTRAIVSEPFQRGQNISVIGSLGLDGAGPTMAIEGAVDAVVFETYVEFFLVPTLCLDDIVVLDNVQFHHSARARQLIEAAGAKVLHLPAYSPDFNPIEECISKIKAILRSLKARTKRQLLNALAKALAKITIDDICGWFLDCGYVYSFI